MSTIAKNLAVPFTNDLQSFVHSTIAGRRRGLDERALVVPPSQTSLFRGKPTHCATHQPEPTHRETRHYEKEHGVI